VLGLAREAAYDQLIGVAAQRYGLDPALVKAVIKCESRFDPWAQSPRGAQGLMQLMPATQTLLGVTDAFNPQHNVIAGVRYLALLKQTFGNNVTLLLAAYNAGPQSVIDAGYAVPPYAETQHYVRCVLDAQRHYQQNSPQVSATTLPGHQQTADRNLLVVSPLRFSSRVAHLGQKLTLYLEALNASTRPAHGVVMLNYPEHLVSFMALHTVGDTTVQLPAAPTGRPTSATAAGDVYRLLWSHWPAWQPGERRTATIALVPHVPQDMMVHVSVVLHTSQAAPPQHWSSVVRVPFDAAKR
jgi:Transglycosylase SLT domain